MNARYPIPVLREVDNLASKKRREEYALTRDQQAIDNNEAIKRRFISEEKNLVKCKQCGKEFSAGPEPSDNHICPDCRQKFLPEP